MADPSLISIMMLGLAFFGLAILYSSVGHGGASGYLAAMALAGLSPALMRPTALSLNIVVTIIGTFFYARAGCIPWKTVLLFVVPSAPCAFLGAMIELPEWGYRTLVGLVLLYAAWKTVTQGAKQPSGKVEANIPIYAALPAGAAIGLLSGLTGVGGGIFLTPLLLLTGWTSLRLAAGISCGFILVNSISGILGLGVAGFTLPPAILWWVLAVCSGALIGSRLGSGILCQKTQSRLLAVVLTIAGIKMLMIFY